MAQPSLGTKDASDLNQALRTLAALYEGKNIFLTGGTGFFGSWLVQGLLQLPTYANARSTIGILSRTPDEHRRRFPWLSHPAVKLHMGDILSFEPPAENFEYMIHAAVPASAVLIASDPARMLELNVLGTKQALNCAHAVHAKHFLLTSSGAVYGKQPVNLGHLDEEYMGGPDISQASSAYGEGKRVAELMSVIEGERSGLSVKLARCFAFVGPYLPLDTHFAAGNFINDLLSQRAIKVLSDGTAVRSYLYGIDLVTWLLTILVKGQHARPYNVGSDEPYTVLELANLTQHVGAELGLCAPAQVLPGQAARPGQRGARYLPSVARAREELGLQQTVTAHQGVRRTIEWHLSQMSTSELNRRYPYQNAEVPR